MKPTMMAPEVVARMTRTRTSSLDSFSREDFTASAEPWTSALTMTFRFFISPA